MSISEEIYQQIARNDLVKKKQGGIYRVVNVLKDERRNILVCDQVNHPAENVLSLVKDDIDTVWQKRKQ